MTSKNPDWQFEWPADYLLWAEDQVRRNTPISFKGIS